MEEDYPRTLAEFERRFATDEDCRAYLVQLRWPEGFRCPRCRSNRCWPVKRGLLKCAQCGHQASVTAGTIFHRSRVRHIGRWKITQVATVIATAYNLIRLVRLTAPA